MVATYRLPWQFKVEKGAAARGDQFSHNSGYHSGQQPTYVDAPTPCPYARNELEIPTLEPLMPSTPALLSLSEGEHHEAPCVPTPNTQAKVASDPGANWVVGYMQSKRDRAEAGLDDEDSQDITRKRNVRRRLEQRHTIPAGTAGPSAPSADHSSFRPSPGADGTTSHGVSSSNGSPTASATPSAPPSDPSLRPVQRRQSSAQPVELITTILRAANPRCGPVSGGREIWLVVEDLPTTFTLYAKFGDRVAATVSSTFHPFSSSNLHISRFGMSLRYHVCFPTQVKQAVCRLHYPVQPILGLFNMGRALLNLNTLAITPRCESGYSSLLHRINCFHSIPILLRMEEKGRPEYTPTRGF